MNGESSYYTDAEWEEAAGHRPLRDLPRDQVGLLHRHWIWANYAFRMFERTESARPPGEVPLEDEHFFAMYLWYGLLWSVIEGVRRRRIVLRGRFATDLRLIADGLREARHAVFHVGEPDGYYDQRLFKIMAVPGAVPAIWRVHKGFARLFYEELNLDADPQAR
jgi:hypothetical protein